MIRDAAMVQAVLTEAAAEMVGPATFQALTGRPAEVGKGGRLAASGMPHIDLGRQADAIVVAPATANTLAKLAVGLADNLLTSTVLSSTCPLVLAPAMNTRMWEHPATRDNVARLRQRERVVLVEPAWGSLACGEEGRGRMEEPEVILEAVRITLGPKDLERKTLLITAGPTREPLDPVRYLSNRSSGKMGYALAAAARRRGAKVTLVTGPVGIDPPPGVKMVAVTTAREMGKAVDANLKKSHALIMAAAVADFEPRKLASKKLKKGKGAPSLQLRLTRDILGSIDGKKHGCLLVGFAAETGNPSSAASRKLKEKKLDLVVANDVTRPDAGFDVDTNVVTLVDAEGAKELPRLSKQEVADRILDRVVQLFGARRRK
jgi:phosphopantothenoylcysteine decarboxylase/phosphopantothenate--cysteine ligase